MSHGREVASISTDIACQKREAVNRRVRADIEFRQNALLRLHRAVLIGSPPSETGFRDAQHASAATLTQR